MKKKREGFAKWINSGKRTIILSFIILGLVMSGGIFLNLTPISDNKTPPEPTARNIELHESETEEEPQLPVPGSVRPLKILLIGTDGRPGEPSISNTDTLVVAQINPQTGQIALLSVPRDTQVLIPRYGSGKINTAARVGEGLDGTKKVLENLLGIKLDGYLLTDFAGFKESIDMLGGITVAVEKDMYYNTGDQEDGIINLKKGTQRLNGTQALQYARFRQDALADISRTMRQQVVLKAAAQELIQLKTLPKLPKIIPQLVRSVKTDLQLKEILALANVMVRLNKATVISQTLPGNFVIEQGISYWQVNTQETKEVARDFFSSGKTVDIFSHRVSSQLAQGADAEKNRKISVEKHKDQSGLELNSNPEIKVEINENQSIDTRIKNQLKLPEPQNKHNEVQDSIVVEVEILPPS